MKFFMRQECDVVASESTNEAGFPLCRPGQRQFDIVNELQSVMSSGIERSPNDRPKANVAHRHTHSSCRSLAGTSSFRASTRSQ